MTISKETYNIRAVCKLLVNFYWLIESSSTVVVVVWHLAFLQEKDTFFCF